MLNTLLNPNLSYKQVSEAITQLEGAINPLSIVNDDNLYAFLIDLFSPALHNNINKNNELIEWLI